MSGLFDDKENNVGQFGADDSNIIRYKQAAEYAEDARLYALAAAEAMTDADSLLTRAEEILQEARDLLAQVEDVTDQVDEALAIANEAKATAEEAVALAQESIDQSAAILTQVQAIQTDVQANADLVAASVTDAANSATQAEAAQAAAESAVAGIDAQVEAATEQADRAEAEADRAEAIASTLPTKDMFVGFAKLYDTNDEAVADLPNREVGEKVLVWSQDTATYGWFDITGTDDAKELTLDRNEKKIKTINNVQPDDAGNVQISLPNGNPSLWLGETVLFQYDPDQGIGYSGILPQDGREVTRAAYPDMWAAISQGLVPSVTEAEWQAGAQNSFSDGDGSTTFRLPKWSGEAIRTPSVDEEGNTFFEQIPYVVTVNGIAPNDTTGNVQLTGLAASGVNGDITSLTALSGPLTLGGSASLSVVNGDVALPTNGSVVYGGEVRSVYQVNSVNYSTAKLKSTATIGTSRGVVISLEDNSTGAVVNTDWALPTGAGTLALQSDSRFNTIDGNTGGSVNGTIVTTGSVNTISGVVTARQWFSSEVGQTGPRVGSGIWTGTTGAGAERCMFQLSSEISASAVRRGHLTISSDATNPKDFVFYQDSGSAAASGTWIAGSDERHKTNITLVPNALNAVLSWRGSTYNKKDGGAEVGLIAQDVEKDCPVAITNMGERVFSDGTVIEDFKALNVSGVAAAYHTEAIKELYSIIQGLQDRIAALEAK